MKSRLSKNTVLALFCFSRQAERSIHFALSSPSQWPEFVAYYDDQKRRTIADLVVVLKQAGAVPNGRVDRHSFSRSIAGALVQNFVGRLRNKAKQSWLFALDEMSFLCSSFERLLTALDRNVPLDFKSLIDLRMDLWQCQSIIGWKLVGVPELKRAQMIEHFNQSDFLEHITMQEMGVDASQLLPVG